MTAPSTDDGIALKVAGTVIPDADRLVARYGGLTGEVWAYAFYDAIPLDGREPSRLDLLAAAIMHGPVRRTDLQWFMDSSRDIGALLARLPADVDLGDADDSLLDDLAASVDELTREVPQSVRGLLTKILHRRRPRLVAIDERDIGRRYARALQVPGRLAYRELLESLAKDLALNEAALDELVVRHPLQLTRLRLIDISVWCDANMRQR